MSEQLFLILALAVCFVFTLLSTKWIIPKLKSMKMGQKILDIGPRWHKSKEGTPTMGGLAFILSITATMLIAWPIRRAFGMYDNSSLLLVVYFFALANGIIGMVDDYAKFSKGKNQGLRSWQKFLLQLIVSGGLLLFLSVRGYTTTELYLPFVNVYLQLGAFYYVVMLLLLTGVPNSVNLTDGIDGLAASVTLIVAAFFAAVGLAGQPGQGIALFALLIAGACLGFLCYNFHPARIFMGDTGSLFLGGAVAAMAFMIGNPLIILIVGIIYIIETASVMLQVGYFKLSGGKRIFKMAPIHHHFEKSGWGEVKIVLVFSLVTLVMAVGSYFLM
ncbi:MAG: phospho-N-acetylmuramoyl-pentapeptide-transferase [Oscillospiraceae bacterium]|nr:phospho-N-acetylmuramoyl-pentapeptide-transferase [Oscillospiraceae bacterium]